MQMSTLLLPEAVKSIASCTSKKRLFHDLGDLAESCYGLPAGAVVEALIAREGLGPTGVGNGIALPHTRLPEAEAVLGLFIRLDKPINFEAIDRQPVDLIFALIAPEEAGVDHLKALALVSRTLRDANTCEKLRANSEAATLHTILTELPASRAA